MRTDCKTIYRYGELGEDARTQALEDVGTRLPEWIESDDLGEVMTEVLGYELGHHDGGFGEPLIGIEISEWSIDRNGRDHLRISGTLHRDSTPKLPWPDDCSYARFGRTNIAWTCNERDLWLEDHYPEWMADDDREDVQAFWSALDDVLDKALAAGCAEYDYKCSDEYAAEWLDANDPEVFDEEGNWL